MPMARPTAAGSGRSCTSEPPTTTLIDAPFQPSNASHSAARSDSSSAAPIGLADDRADAVRARQCTGDREPEASDSSHPARSAGDDHRPDPSGFDDGRQRVDPLGIGVGEPEDADLDVGREGRRRPTRDRDNAPREGRSPAKRSRCHRRRAPARGVRRPARTPEPRVSCIVSTPNRRGASLASHGPGTANAR